MREPARAPLSLVDVSGRADNRPRQGVVNPQHIAGGDRVTNQTVGCIRSEPTLKPISDHPAGPKHAFGGGGSRSGRSEGEKNSRSLHVKVQCQDPADIRFGPALNDKAIRNEAAGRLRPFEHSID